MLAVHARYRGRSVRRAELVQRSATALSTLDGVGEFHVLGVEDICAVAHSASSVCDVVMALLADGDWAIGIGVSPGASGDEDAARQDPEHRHPRRAGQRADGSPQSAGGAAAGAGACGSAP